MNTLYFAIIALLFCPPTYSKWVSHSNNTMPRDNTMLAVGSYNGKIYLLGGNDNNQNNHNHRQQTTYDIEQDLFVFYRSGYIPNENKVFGEAQFWTQIESNLYILDDLKTPNRLSVFDMENNIYISDWDTIPETMSAGSGQACLTSHLNSIFINGGVTSAGTPRKATHVLNISTMTWGLGSEMQIARRSHSCIVHPNTETALYSIGGSSTNSLTATIEKIFIENIHDVQWTYLSTNLSNATKGMRSLIYDNFIIIIGGVDQSRTWYDTIHIIDTRTDSVTVSNMTLAFGTAYSAVIMVNNIMYSFGGRLGMIGMDAWQTETIKQVTIEPTASTTSVPTPTNAPAPTTTTTTTEGLGEEGAPAKEGSPLTVGNAVGVGFGIALLICLIIVVAFFCIRNKRGSKEFEGVHDKERDETDNVELNGNNGHNELKPSGKPYDTDDNEEKVDTAVINNDW